MTAGTLSLGIGSNAGFGNPTGILDFDTGTFTATTVILGSKSGASGTGSAVGTIALSVAFNRARGTRRASR